jgi:hypothetical protein
MRLVLNRIGARHAAGVLGAGILAWVLLAGLGWLSDQIGKRAARCEIVGLLNNCPGQPTFSIKRRDGTWLEESEAAVQSKEACLQRAEDYHEWCQADGPVVARFFRESKLVAERLYPTAAPNRCEIVGLQDNCPAQPTFRIRKDGIWRQDPGETANSASGCFKRAGEFQAWCRSRKPIVARYFQDSKLVDEKSFEPIPETRCEIAGLRDNCPAQATFHVVREDGVWIEDSGGIARSRSGCFQRAGEYQAWCRAQKPIVARFFQDSRLVEEKSFQLPPETRCEIAGLRNNCPAQPTLKIVRPDGLVVEDPRGVARSQQGCFQRAGEYHAWCRAQKPIQARFFQDSKLLGEKSFPEIPATRCEIAGLRDNCPAQPTFHVAGREGIVTEGPNQAGRSQDACFQRAGDFRAWCRSPKPIVARFFQESKMVGERSFPDAPPGRCEIAGLRGNCPAQPTFKIARQDGIVSEDPAGRTQDGCFRRAQEFHAWCGAKNPVVARYFQGTKLVAEKSFPEPPARCEIEGLRDNCPAQPTFRITRTDGVWLEDTEGGPARSLSGCLRRAEEFAAWCGAKGTLTVRYFQGKKLIERKSLPALAAAGKTERGPGR